MDPPLTARATLAAALIATLAGTGCTCTCGRSDGSDAAGGGTDGPPGLDTGVLTDGGGPGGASRRSRDLDGDGFADLAVAAPLNDAAGQDAGRVYVFLGGPALETTADAALSGAGPGDSFGRSLAMPGDLNADGYADLAVGAPLADAGGVDAGAAYLYFGGPGPGFDPVADVVLVGAAPGDAFGWAVAAAGDVNGDGYDDLVVGAAQATFASTLVGYAHVFLGGPGGQFDATPDGALAGTQVEGAYGTAVGGGGDVNGDGYDDVVVGASSEDSTEQAAGALHLYLGGPGAKFDGMADGSLYGEAFADGFGYAVTSAGDVDGDGYADVVAGAYSGGPLNEGRVYVFRGGPGPFDLGVDAVIDPELPGVGGQWFGAALASDGDAGGDGVDDLVVGAFFSGAAAPAGGRFCVYFGGPAGPGATAGCAAGPSAFDHLGESVAWAGDVDGDGHDDALVGAPMSGGLSPATGRAELYLGGAGAAFDAASDATFAGAEVEESFGRSVALRSSPKAPSHEMCRWDRWMIPVRRAREAECSHLLHAPQTRPPARRAVRLGGAVRGSGLGAGAAAARFVPLWRAGRDGCGRE